MTGPRHSYLGGSTRVTSKILFTLSGGPVRLAYISGSDLSHWYCLWTFQSKAIPVGPFPTFQAQLWTFTPLTNKRDLVSKMNPKH